MQADTSQDRDHRNIVRAERWRNIGMTLSLLVAIAIAAATLTRLPLAAPPSPGLDKIAHFLAFAALTLPLIGTDSRRWYWVLPLAIGYGGAIELLQPLVGREAEWLDWGADASGALAGAALGEILHDRLQRAGILDPRGAAAGPMRKSGGESEAQRAELIEDMRAVLREELAGMNRRNDEQDPRG